MAVNAPTRQVLRHLRRLCQSSDLITATYSSNVRSTIRTKSQINGLIATASHVDNPRHRPCQNITRTYSTTPRTSQPQPSSSTTNTTTTDRTSEPPSQSLPDITNFYTLFPKTLPSGPPPSGSFTVPLPALKREFLQLQSLHHPDKYTASPGGHSKSLALSSLLNSAYKTLSDPLLRARYLLEHTYNIDITSEDNSIHRGVTDQTTLMEVMEAQEQIEEAQTQEQIDALKLENRTRIQDAEGNLARAFETEDVHTAKTECVRLNYWRTLQQGLDDWEPGKEVRLIH